MKLRNCTNFVHINDYLGEDKLAWRNLPKFELPNSKMFIKIQYRKTLIYSDAPNFDEKVYFFGSYDFRQD